MSRFSWGVPVKLPLHWLAVLVLLCLTAGARASIRPVAVGEVPTLKPDEGLLLVDVDTQTPIDALRFVQPGNDTGSKTITDLPKGQTTRLYVVTAGSYHWSRLEFTSHDHWFFFELNRYPDLAFEVRPGVINYPGDFLYRPSNRIAVRVPNRALVGIDWLRANAPGVYTRFDFDYSGHYPDPFPAFYKAALTAHPTLTDADLQRTLPAPAAGTLPIPIEELFRKPRVRSVRMNPRGDLVAEITYADKGWHVDVIDLGAEQATRVLDLDYDITGLQWISDQTLAVTAGTAAPVVRVFHIGAAGPKGRQHTGYAIPVSGVILAAIPGKPDHVLFQHGPSLYDLDISSADAFLRNQFAFNAQIDRGLHGVLHWFVDGNAQPRAAVVRDRDGYALYWGSNGSFRQVLRIDPADPILPLAVSADGSAIYALTDKDRAQRELVEIDPKTGAIARTVYSKPGRDIELAVADTHGNLIGAGYLDDGLLVTAFFDQANAAIEGRIAKAFPGEAALIVGRSDAGTQFLVLVTGSDRPGQFYHFDATAGTAELIDDSKPWLSKDHLASAKVIQTKGSDGLPIEAYLTMPVNAKGRVPLIVYAHGGPIGYRDSLGFDPSVQLFASLGYAVLQVNFRGSEGYGKAFREAGEHHYGSLIEDDIDAATRAALAQYPLDDQRICAVGASYGGFSAMMSAIRWPGRFRCVVSISGPTDQLLMFSASDTGAYAKGRTALVKAIGDPMTDAERMRTAAPIYRYQELTVPVMLVHGTEDPRVDYEHTRRMVRMLNIAGREPVLLTLPGEGHGGWSEKDEATLWTAVAGFLRAHLDAKPPG